MYLDVGSYSNKDTEDGWVTQELILSAKMLTVGTNALNDPYYNWCFLKPSSESARTFYPALDGGTGEQGYHNANKAWRLDNWNPQSDAPQIINIPYLIDFDCGFYKTKFKESCGKNENRVHMYCEIWNNWLDLGSKDISTDTRTNLIKVNKTYESNFNSKVVSFGISLNYTKPGVRSLGHSWSLDSPDEPVLKSFTGSSTSIPFSTIFAYLDNNGNPHPKITYKNNENGLDQYIIYLSNTKQYGISLPHQKWNNIVLNYRDLYVDIFINGNLEVTIRLTDLPKYTNTDTISIGENGINELTGLYGSICNVVYYKNIMTKGQIIDNYNLLSIRNPPVNS
jgi:hypothetical protein